MLILIVIIVGRNTSSLFYKLNSRFVSKTFLTNTLIYRIFYLLIWYNNVPIFVTCFCKQLISIENSYKIYFYDIIFYRILVLKLSKKYIIFYYHSIPIKSFKTSKPVYYIYFLIFKIQKYLLIIFH